MSIEIQFTHPEDATEIAHLFAGGFRPEVKQLLIYGCYGAAEYIQLQLTLPALCAESIYFVARSGRHIVGAAELRKRDDGLFLNYIGVRQDSRGNVVGTAPLSRAVKLAGR
jgi:hypothetical protein